MWQMQSVWHMAHWSDIFVTYPVFMLYPAKSYIFVTLPALSQDSNIKFLEENWLMNFIKGLSKFYQVLSNVDLFSARN